MPQVAIIKRYSNSCYECGANVDLGISDWAEVTAEDLNRLKAWCTKHTTCELDYHVFERIDNKEIPLMISEITKDIAEDKIRIAKEKAEREQKKREIELKKLAKTQEKKKELLIQLKRELGEV